MISIEDKVRSLISSPWIINDCDKQLSFVSNASEATKLKTIFCVEFFADIDRHYTAYLYQTWCNIVVIWIIRSREIVTMHSKQNVIGNGTKTLVKILY